MGNGQTDDGNWKKLITFVDQTSQGASNRQQ